MAKVLTQRAERLAASMIDWLVMEGIDRTTAAARITSYTQALVGKPAKSTKPPVPSADVLRVMNVYTALYRERYGTLPVVAAPEFALAATVIRQHGVDAVIDQLQVLAQTIKTDDFVARQGLSFSTLSSQWTRLLERARRTRRQAAGPADCRHTPRCLTDLICTEKYLADVSNGSSARTSSVPTTATRSGPS